MSVDSPVDLICAVPMPRTRDDTAAEIPDLAEMDPDINRITSLLKHAKQHLEHLFRLHAQPGSSKARGRLMQQTVEQLTVLVANARRGRQLFVDGHSAKRRKSG